MEPGAHESPCQFTRNEVYLLLPLFIQGCAHLEFLYSAEAVLDSALPRIVVIGEQSAGKRLELPFLLTDSVS